MSPLTALGALGEAALGCGLARVVSAHPRLEARVGEVAHLPGVELDPRKVLEGDRRDVFGDGVERLRELRPGGDVGRALVDGGVVEAGSGGARLQ